MAGGRDEMQCAHECMTLGRMLTFPTVRTCRDVTPPSFAPLLTALLGVLLLVPLVPATRTADADEVSAAERRHDRINTVLLTPLCVALVGSWLCAVDAYTVALALCAYVLWDGAYLLTHATAVRTRRIILTHHVVTLIFALVPLHHHDLAEFTAIAGGAELQTLALVVRRQLREDARKPKALLRAVSFAHDVCFVGVRLVFHPLLFVGMCTVMHAPRLESIVVIGCQGLLCTFNVVLWLRERRRADSSR